MCLDVRRSVSVLNHDYVFAPLGSTKRRIYGLCLSMTSSTVTDMRGAAGGRQSAAVKPHMYISTIRHSSTYLNVPAPCKGTGMYLPEY